jgi:hypothetical protein
MAALFTAAGLTMAEVSSNRCERRGRLSIARLLAEHGHALPGPELRHVTAADCPRTIAGKNCRHVRRPFLADAQAATDRRGNEGATATAGSDPKPGRVASAVGNDRDQSIS